MHDQATVWNEVSNWPPEERRALAMRILDSLHRRSSPTPAAQERVAALRQLIGIWNAPHKPNDAEVEQIIEQERMRKYG